MVYGDFNGPGRRKTKPIQSQSRLAPRPALGVEEKDKIMKKTGEKEKKTTKN